MAALAGVDHVFAAAADWLCRAAEAVLALVLVDMHVPAADLFIVRAPLSRIFLYKDGCHV